MYVFYLLINVCMLFMYVSVIYACIYVCMYVIYVM